MKIKFNFELNKEDTSKDIPDDFVKLVRNKIEVIGSLQVKEQYSFLGDYSFRFNRNCAGIHLEFENDDEIKDLISKLNALISR